MPPAGGCCPAAARQGRSRPSGVPVTDVAELTGFPAILGHRVVTLHPKVHGGILADTSDPSHRADLAEYGIEPIDLVVVNLYPFATDPGVELIDIGGPAMVRAAAKNHDRVAVVVDPGDYGGVLGEIRAEGQVTGPTRRSLARKAFATTAAYDAEIVSWLDAEIGEPSVAGIRTRSSPIRCGAARGAEPVAAPSAGTAVRREPAPARRPLSLRGRSQLVGRRRAARRQGAELPQPL